ncbi:type II toxin-antitoxin system VapC family toxin [Phenylobacterium sp.]|uniref:type II toxin-antitoxin system VapC family toxin n=1 Tax=Phenylobacterium sp. TaxID=1871053 RepID=UPI002BBE514E|nr:type II toxin-antitoxin system VapC family toxin [Phenylobacterium sp.]HLZ74232.1 type II toxin-antitoxin system VapC family toxin [Phenylobacterium sp.]
MTRPILLDTCALIWFANNDILSRAAEDALVAADASGVAVSPISAWEIGMLVAKGRLRMTSSPMDWFQRVIDLGVALAPLPPAILIASSSLPSDRLRDPADRIIAATARALNYRLMTRDKPLLDFAADGHMTAIAC